MSAQAAEAKVSPGADDTPLGLQEVIVTAQKRSENLQAVPLAVTALTADALDQANINGATDITRLATSLQYAQNASVRGTGFQVRGVGTQSFSNGLEQSVGTVVDGVVMARNGMGDGDLLDIDHVEVLRGPQGMLFGKNASAGVVSIVTKRPTDELSAEGPVSRIGTYNDLRADAVLNIPLAANTAVRLAGFSNRRDGLVKNVFDGGKLNDHQESGARANSWRSENDDLELYVNADLSVIDGTCCVSTARSVVAGSRARQQPRLRGHHPGPRQSQGGSRRRRLQPIDERWNLGGSDLAAG